MKTTYTTESKQKHTQTKIHREMKWREEDEWNEVERMKWNEK